MKIALNIISLVVAAGLASASIITVPGDQPTILAGINAASDGDTVLVADGIYTGTGNKNLDFGGRAITVMSANGPEACIIDCEGVGRGVYFHTGEDSNSVFSGFTIRNGVQGTIFLMNVDNPVIDNCVIIDGTPAGIFCMGSDPLIIRCIIKGCESGGNGGGIALSTSNARIIKCTIYDNQAGFGGAVHCNSSNPYISSCIFAGNAASGC